MLTARLFTALLGSAFLNLNMTTCQAPGEGKKAPEAEPDAPVRVKLEGVDTKDLSPREEAQWSAHVRELLAPCKKTPVSVAECVEQKRDCAACRPAASFLVSQVKEGKTRPQVELAYKERFSPDTVFEIDVDGSPSKGPPNAPITIVEWADFECPACQVATPVLSEIVKTNKDVRLVFKNFPLDGHENAVPAARAAMAADMQGKFWEMHQALFTSRVPLTQPTIESLAAEIKLDMDRFKEDQRSEAIADLVTRDRKQGEAVKLQATPSIFVNGRRFSYNIDLKAGLVDWISLEREIMPKEEK